MKREHVCCTCGKKLGLSAPVVYLGWGGRHDGKPGLGWVAALCAPTPVQVGAGGSPCVASAREWAEKNGIALTPSDAGSWHGRQ